MTVPLDGEQERRFQRLVDELVMVDLHQHVMVLPDAPAEFLDYFRSNAYAWGYEAVLAGGWATVGTANGLSCLGKHPDASFSRFGDLVDELALMLADMSKQNAVATISRADDVLRAKQAGNVGFLPSVEHMAIGHDLHRVDVLYGLGVRLAGLTYARRNYVGDGQDERTDCGLSEFGVEVVRRMNDLGMIIDLSHAGCRTALETIEMSQGPVVFSHNAAHALRPTRRARHDDELLACAKRGGVIGVTAVPNSLSDDPTQDINVVLDHYDYLAKLVGVDHVAIGSDTLIGDHVGFHRVIFQRGREFRPPAPYLNGLESPADGKNIVRGLIARGYHDDAIAKIAGQNAVALMRRVMG